MSYYFAKNLDSSFDAAVKSVIAALKVEGFGVLTTIDVQATLKSKLGVEFPRYTILGACSPALAHKALLAENKIGTMLPCNVIVRETGGGKTEVAAVDPVSSMQAVQNPALAEVASQVRQKLRNVIESLETSAAPQ